ncbi:CRISPR-associated helicase Cas3' [Nocardia tengchongensis]|uniref:CRISPR-associated helicase Cas3' n=1 Tax=Nocardia tengchongensis TaxID=2055889 RepID=UPI0036C233B7
MCDFIEIDLRLWGKSKGLPIPYPLVCHLLDTASAVGVLWDAMISGSLRQFLAAQFGCAEDDARRLLMFLAALHDVGKLTPGFQWQDRHALVSGSDYPADEVGPVRHDMVANIWLSMPLREYGFSARNATTFGQLLGGHHGCFFALEPIAASDAVRAVPAIGSGAWEVQRRALVDAMIRLIGPPTDLASVAQDAAGVSCGLITLADWLVSQESFLRKRLPSVPHRGDPQSLQVFFAGAASAVAAVVREAGIGRLRLAMGDFVAEHGFAPNSLQSSVIDRLPGLLTGGAGLLLVAAPMGLGKTELALTAARVMGDAAGTPGIFFALPTMATSDPMYLRLKEFGHRRILDDAGLALLHSMSWMNPNFGPDTDSGEVITAEDAEPEVATTSLAVSDWLRGSKRGLLAPWAVGTVDQALIAAVCGRYNMLRMLGLSGKVLVVDEVHAYDAYMQQLLSRLLTWLGRLSVPVVLMSATLPRLVAQYLVTSYLRGAGITVHQQYSFDYPGWLYADTITGAVTASTVKCDGKRLTISLMPIPAETGKPDRGAALRTLLSPLMSDARGCVGIICNTVAESQQTYMMLRELFDQIETEGAEPPALTLLHSRFPADRREEITVGIIGSYGKGGARPRGVVVATQVIEQSIDLDFDLIISDLAPVAQLLQRSGRGHRHADNPRPKWAREPALVVLVPTDSSDELVLPSSWPFVYPISLLTKTYRDLVARAGCPDGQFTAGIPEDVQALMETVYDQSFLDEATTADDLDHLANEQTQRAVADLITIPEPDDLMDLHPLTQRELDDSMLTTRLGADSGRVVCCYTDSHDNRWLDPQHTIPLPVAGSGKGGRFSSAQVEAVLKKAIPVPGNWVAGANGNDRPDEWKRDPYLRQIRLLTPSGPELSRFRLGDKEFKLSATVGLRKL